MTTLSPRDVIRGNPPTPDHPPDPADLVDLLERFETQFAGGIKTFQDDKAALDLVSATNEDIGFVLADATPSLDGVYQSNGTVWTKIAELPGGFSAIVSGDIDNAKLADVATATFKGRTTAGTGTPEDLTVTQAKTLLGLQNLNNTSDVDKPVSTAQQTALAGKADASALDAKAAKEDPELTGKVTINDVIMRAAESGVAWGIGDDAGDLLALLTALGVFRANGMEIPGLQIIQINDPVWRFYIGDDDGNIVFGVTIDGEVRTVTESDAYFDAAAQVISLVFVEGWQDAASDAAITWVSDDTEQTVMEYRLRGATEWVASNSVRTRAFPNLSGKYLHTVVISGLSANATYDMRWPGSIVTDSFKTAARAGITVVMASDHQNTDFSATGIAGDFGTVVTAEEIDLLILNGDYVNDDGQFTTTFGQRWFDFLTQISRDYRSANGSLVPFVGTVGNHEGRNIEDTSNALEGGDGTIGMIETILSWGYDPEHPGREVNSAATLSVGKELFIITVETDHTESLPDQATWFAAQLATNVPNHRNTIVVGHCPAWLGMATFELDNYDTQARALRNTFWPIMNLYADKIRCYFCGHEHILTITDKLKMNYDAGLSLVENDTRWTTNATDGVRQLCAGPWAGTRYDLDAADMAAVSGIDASPKFIAAMGYDTPGDIVQTYGTGLTNADKDTWCVWISTYSATTFTARAVDRNGLDFYSISESI
jgi:Calcineurin-like phosphoesterase